MKKVLLSFFPFSLSVVLLHALTGWVQHKAYADLTLLSTDSLTTINEILVSSVRLEKELVEPTGQLKAPWNGVFLPEIQSSVAPRFNSALGNYFSSDEFRSSDQDSLIGSCDLLPNNCRCQDQVNVTLGPDGTYTLGLQQVGAGFCLDLEVIVNDSQPGNQNIIDCAGTFTYGIFDPAGELVCWGEVRVEDKTPPSFKPQLRRADQYLALYQNWENERQPDFMAFRMEADSIVLDSVFFDTGFPVNFSADVNPTDGQLYLLAGEARWSGGDGKRNLYRVDLANQSTALVKELPAYDRGGGAVSGPPQAMTFSSNGLLYVIYQRGIIVAHDLVHDTQTLIAEDNDLSQGGVGLAYDDDNNCLLVSTGAPVKVFGVDLSGTVSLLYDDDADEVVDDYLHGIHYLGNDQLLGSNWNEAVYLVDLGQDTILPYGGELPLSVKSITTMPKPLLYCEAISFLRDLDASEKEKYEVLSPTPLVMDNSMDCDCPLEVTDQDRYEYEDCPEDLSFGESYVFARLIRTYQAVDCFGNQSDTTVTIPLRRPGISTLIKPGDVTEQRCSLSETAVPEVYPYWITNYPTADGDYRLQLDEVDCNYAVTVEEDEFPICGGTGVKIVRYFKVFDWCAEKSRYIDTVVIKVGDFEPPAVQGNAQYSGQELVGRLLARFKDSQSDLRALLPSSFDFSGDVEDNRKISDGGHDMYDGGNVLNTNLATEIPYSNDQVATHPGWGEGFYATLDAPGIWFLGVELQDVSFFEITGDLGADSNGSVRGYTLDYVASDGSKQFSYVKQVSEEEDDPTVNHLIILDGKSAVQDFSKDTNSDQHRISGLSGETILLHLVFAGRADNGDSYLFSKSEVEDFFQAVVEEVLVPARNVGVEPVVVSTGPIDCTAAFRIDDLKSMEEQFGFSVTDCGTVDFSVEILEYAPKVLHGFPLGDSAWRKTNYPTINGMAMGIPVGVYRLAIDLFDGCYNTSRIVVPFAVKDLIAPVMKCDDDLNVTLSTGGYAKVYAADIDEGSWDNCELDELEVRRSVPQACIDSGDFDMDDLVEENGEFFTDWAEYVEFFCCDLAADVKIELRGTDAAVDPLTHMEMPNRNICWMELTIEDKVAPVCTDLPTVMTFCDDPRLDSLAAFGTPAVPFSNCGNIVIEELDPMQDLDNCGFGDIIRRYQAVKNLGAENEQRSAICTQEIQVKERHDYWIKFPEDQDANCGDSVAINGVEYSEDACDLLAVSHQDERFSATQDPDACYKIFRTYRVINWCEYDGEAEPTIVSRDWDRWNGADCTDDYNVNPSQATDGSGSPDGDDVPGNTDIFVIVKRNLGDELPDTVYYDNDSDPTVRTTDNGDTDDPDTDIVETYWWKVISGDFDPTEEDYYEGPSACGTNSVWANDGNQFDSDITGNAQGDDTDERYGSFGYWQYTQHIVVYDNVDPEVTVSGPDTFCSISNVDCAGPVEFEIVATDLCTDDDADVTVTVGLDVGNNGTVDADVTENLEGTTFTARYPIGEHRLVITANDGCGNFRSIFKTFVVEDCKKPAPICINGLSIELMPSEEDSTGAAMGVWASDFLASPIYDCNGQDDTDTDENGNPRVTKFSINKVGEPVDEDQTGVIYNCNDAGQLREVEIHAWDTEGNHDFCLTTVQVDDNMGMCTTPEGEGQITGAIATEEALPVPGVEVQLSGAHSLMYRTDEMGGYAFNGLKEDFDFTVTPHLDRNPLNGVSTFDLVLISKHILGVQPLNSPYKMIAADVNNSKSVTTLDLIQLRKLILNIDTEFSNNTSWRFVDASYNFNNPANPLAESFPEVKNINNLDGEELADFVAIKVGDVNGSALGGAKPRSSQTLVLQMPAQELEAGQEYRIPVTTEQLAEIQGYQLTLEVDPAMAEIVDVEYGTAKTEHMGIFAERGIVTSSWNNPRAGRSSSEGPSSHLLTLVLRARSDGSLREVLRISSHYTVAEAYDAHNQLMEVALQVGEKRATGRMELYQNVPNPFREETVIGFFLPEGGEAELVIRDGQGRWLRRIEGDYAAGYHEVHIDCAQLPAGLLHYTLRQGESTLSRTMVLQR